MIAPGDEAPTDMRGTGRMFARVAVAAGVSTAERDTRLGRWGVIKAISAGP